MCNFIFCLQLTDHRRQAALLLFNYGAVVICFVEEIRYRLKLDENERKNLKLDEKNGLKSKLHLNLFWQVCKTTRHMLIHGVTSRLFEKQGSGEIDVCDVAAGNLYQLMRLFDIDLPRKKRFADRFWKIDDSTPVRYSTGFVKYHESGFDGKLETIDFDKLLQEFCALETMKVSKVESSDQCGDGREVKELFCTLVVRLVAEKDWNWTPKAMRAISRIK
jgi:hypothetical protein